MARRTGSGIGLTLLPLMLFAAHALPAQRFHHGHGMGGPPDRFGPPGYERGPPDRRGPQGFERGPPDGQRPPGYGPGPRWGDDPRYGFPGQQARPLPRRNRACGRGSGGTIIGAIAGGLLGGGGSGRAIDRGCN